MQIASLSHRLPKFSEANVSVFVEIDLSHHPTDVALT